MKVRALRGVCIGVERHLKAGDIADLPPAEVPFLVHIKAVEVFKEPPPEPAAAPDEAETADSTETPAPTEPAESTDTPKRGRNR